MQNELLLSFEISFLSLYFRSLIMSLLSIAIFEFIFLLVRWTARIWINVFFINLERSDHYFLSLFLGYTLCLFWCACYCRSVKLSSFSFILFFSFLFLRPNNLNWCIFKFFLLSAEIWFWVPLVSFTFQLLYFLILEVLFSCFFYCNNLYNLIDVVCLVKPSFNKFL